MAIADKAEQETGAQNDAGGNENEAIHSAPLHRSDFNDATLSRRPMTGSTLSPRRQPFLYLTAALVAGILLSRWAEPARWLMAATALTAIGFSAKFILKRKSAAATVAILIAFLAIGALLALTEKAGVDDSRLIRMFNARAITPDDPVEITGWLTALPEPAPQRYYLDLEAEHLRARDSVIPVKGRVRLMLPIIDPEAAHEFARLALDLSSRVRILVRLEQARNYDNPGSPDFNDFLERNGYDLKGTVKSPLLIERVGIVRENPILAALYRARLRVMEAIDRRFDARVAGTLKAMLTGNRYFLDRETVERLYESATFHTLAISGMHVGIIAWVLLGGRSGIRRRQTIRIIFSALLLWAYAVMVGLAPPVTRATAMITIAITGPLLFRRAASINTVALSAFILLSLKPALVADPGFQLSFTAVAAIVALALPIADRLRATGEWRPSSRTPHPPSCPRALRYFAEALFWDERRFNDEMRRAPVRYRMDKARAARWLGRLRIQWALRAIALLAITSMAIQLCTLPLMVLYFNRAAPVGVLLNVLAGLLTAVMMLASLLTVAIHTLSAWVAAWFEWIVVGAHYMLSNAIAPFADIPAATFRAAHYEGWHSIIYALYFIPLGLLAVLIDGWRPVDRMIGVKGDQKVGTAEKREGMKHSPLLLRYVCGVLLLASVTAVVRPITGSASGKLIAHFLDVGQGDCALIIFPRGSTMLIDAGGQLQFNRRPSHSNIAQASDGASNQIGRGEGEEIEGKFKESAFSVGEAVVSRFLWSLGLTRIDYALATHADADHVGGLSEVLKNFRTGQIIVGSVPSADSEYDRFAGVVARRGIPVAMVKAGEKYEIDGATVEVLWPSHSSAPPSTSGNDDSVVLRIAYGMVSILLTGDIESATEEALLRAGSDLRSDVLKVPHHGSRTSSSEAFVNSVQPRCAIIPAGERNSFGHPHPEVASRYVERGARLFETGRDGMVTVETDGSTLDVRSYRKR